MSHTLMIVASLLGHFSTPLLSNSITISFGSVFCLGNWNLSACLSGNLVAHLSWDLSFYLILDGVALLLRLVLCNLSVLSGTLLSIFSIARLPGHLCTLFPRNLLTFLSGHILTFLFRHLFALLSGLVLALLSRFIPTLLPWLIPALLLTIDIATLPLGHCRTLSLRHSSTFLFVESRAFLFILGLTLLLILSITLLLILIMTLLLILSLTILLWHLGALLLGNRFCSGNLDCITFLSGYIIYFVVINSGALVIILSITFLLHRIDCMWFLHSATILSWLIPAFILINCLAGWNTSQAGRNTEQRQTQNLIHLKNCMFTC